METKQNCECKCDCSQIRLEMTLREILEKFGIDPEKAQKFCQDNCKCCGAK